MEKETILSMVCDAIIEVSSYAGELLSDMREADIEEVFLVDLGINSIDYAEIALIVMDKLGISHPLDIFARTNNLKEIVDIFCELRA